jgi:hypothetical protein
MGGQPAMSGLLLKKEFSAKAQGEKIDWTDVGDRKMTGARRKKPHWDSLPERWGNGEEENLANLRALELIVKGSTDNPEAFLEEWLRPLLRQGVSMERAYEMVLESVLRPN